jgi:haloalkane dehalogenase
MPDALSEFLREHPGRDLDLGGLRYHYIDEGDGDPVVMVHGNPLWSFYYRRLIEELSPDHRVIVPDHIGCGLSDKPGDDVYEYTLERRISDLETLLNRLGLDAGVTLVVHDWGGAIGFGYAAKYPERIARLVVLNTAAFHKPKSKAFPWPLWFCRDTPLGTWFVRGLNGFCLGTAAVGCKIRPMPKDVRAAYLSPYDSWDHRIAIHHFVRDIPLKPGDRSYDVVSFIEGRLDRFADTPMMIAWGLRDFVFDRHFLAEWERRFPSAEVHRFEKAGHCVLEDLGDEISSLVRAFLAAHPLARANG